MPNFLGNPYSLVAYESERIRSSQPTRNLKQANSVSTAQRWRLRIDFVPTGKENGAALIAHRNHLDINVPFSLEMPQPIGITPVEAAYSVNGSHSAGTSRLSLRMPSGTKIQAGTFFSISGHAKVYQAFNTAEHEGVGFANRDLVITPPLVAAVASGSSIDLSPQIAVRYAIEGRFGQQHNSAVLAAVQIDVVEALS